MSTFSGPEAAELFNRYLGAIARESDRGAVLVAASLLDAALETVLKKKLVSAIEKKDPLFDGAFAPLHSFSAKIECAFRLGLITRKTKRMLSVFRKLRNDFAHGADTVSTSDEDVKSRLKAMFDEHKEMHQAIIGTIEDVLRSDAGGQLTQEDVFAHPKAQRAIIDVFFASNAMSLRRVELDVEPIPELA